MAALLEPTVVAALVAGLVTLTLPWVSARVKLSANGRVEDTKRAIREMDAAAEIRKELREEVALLKTERREAFERIDALRDEIQHLRAALGETEVVVQRLGAEMQEHLEGHPGGAELDRLYLEALARIRKGLGVDQRRTG